MKALVADTSPNTESFTVTRRYLTEREVERLIEAAKSNRHGHRDATMNRLQTWLASFRSLRAAMAIRSSSTRAGCTFEEPSRERRACILSVVMRCAPCAS
jgi:hypothetical protein